MKQSVIVRSLSLATGAMLIHWPATASACSACMGDPNSKTAGAINTAIFVMLGCIGLVLGGLASFAIYLMRRAA